MSPALDFRLPLETAGFRIERLLGSGAMGEVYLAEELAGGRRVALKVLSSWHLDSKVARERFEREARLAASVSHPHVVFVYGVHEIERAPAIAMELMSGETLADHLLVDPPPPIHRVVAWMLQVIDGLEAANKSGVLHRDVKPANCFFASDGRVKIGDFGLARAASSESSITKLGTFIGTPLFASPEQARGRALDLRSDIYSVGATLYALLAGVPAYHGGDAGETLLRIVNDEPEDPRKHRPDLPRELVRVVLKAMAKGADERFADYDSFRRALQPFANQPASAAAASVAELRPHTRHAARGALDEFEIQATLGSTPRGRLLLARDPKLSREVWIHLISPLATRGQSGTAPPHEASRMELHTIHRARGKGSHYDVYEALGGAGLGKALQQNALTTWAAAHPLFVDLCEHLKTRPAPLHVEQLWIDHNGKLRVLDFALAAAPRTKLAPLDLLAHVVSELKPDAFEDLATRTNALLARLLGEQRPTLEQLHEHLHSPASDAVVLTRARRMSQMSAVGALVVAAAYAASRLRDLGDAAHELARAPSASEFTQHAQLMCTLFGGLATLGTLLALLLKRPVSFALFQLDLRRQAGGTADFGRAVLRSIVAWTPLLAMAGAAWLDQPEPTLRTYVTAALALAFYLANFAFALVQPRASLVDRIAGTRVARY